MPKFEELESVSSSGIKAYKSITEQCLRYQKDWCGLQKLLLQVGEGIRYAVGA